MKLFGQNSKRSNQTADTAIDAETISVSSTDIVKKPKRKKRKISVKKVVAIVAAIAVLACGAFGIWKLFFGKEEQIPMTSKTTYGALNRAIEGSGTTVPYESEMITAVSRAKITEVLVSVGDFVQEGDILYRQDDSEIDKQISTYQSQIESYEDEIIECENSILTLNESLEDYYEELASLKSLMKDPAIRAPHSGHISGIKVEVDDEVRENATLATLTDDSKFRLPLYFSYIYKDEINVGDLAYVTIEDSIVSIVGKVSEISYVDLVTDLGLKCFSVAVDFDNPGFAKVGMGAAAYLTSSDGSRIYPSVEGNISCIETSSISSDYDGKIASVNVKEYSYVNKGDILFVLDTESLSTQYEKIETNIANVEKQIKNNEKKITSANSSIETANENIESAEENRENYEMRAGISGKVMYCTIEAGDTPSTSMPVITIYNLEKMQILVNIDELDVDYLEEGMSVSVYRTSASKSVEYTAKISYISPEATSSSGVSTFPVTIDIESNGELSAGVNVTYAVSTGDTEETVLAPVAALKSTESGYCLYVKADKRPTNAIDLSDDDPECPSGFYAVPVEVGSSNSGYIRILSGVDKDTEVFTRFLQTAPKGGNTTSEKMDDGSDDSSGFPNMGNMPSGGMPGGNWSGGNFGGNSGNNSGGFPNGMNDRQSRG